MEDQEVVDELDIDAESHEDGAGDASSADNDGDAGDRDSSKDADADGAGDEGESGSTWEAAKSAISGAFDNLRESKPAGDDKQGDGERKPGKDGEQEEEEEGKEGKEGKPEQVATPARYAIADASGETYELELPEGATIKFKADGRDVEVKSFDDLVSMAQKGAAFDRVAEQRNNATTRVSTLEGELKTQVEGFEDLLLKICFNKEEFHKVRKAIAKYRDPDVREAARKAAAHDERTAKESSQAEQDRTQKVDEYWDRVSSKIDSSLEKFEYLDADDKQAIVKDFYGLIENRFNEVYEELVTANAEREEAEQFSDDELIAAAEAEALKVGTSRNLAAVMQARNDRYAKKAGRNGGNGGKRNGGKPTRQEDRGARRQVAEHNSNVDRARDTKQKNRGIRRGGTPAGVSRSALSDTPKTWEGHKNRIKSAFSELREED
jgi:RNAse (barnase) inhibitor barstar